ncbi:peptidoglycan-binding protein [Pelomonas sp. KK5]|uniref:peptidoglycan-binding protein n=1 Tax=Pelomonas sp. KK5 TaxID=1855730 RepID=UPI00097C674D|nr:peptidoglycan-binding protein [Pelomonas sp. KK5]
MNSTTFRLGDQGADVSTLQQALRDAGFSPGAVDGDFGGGTQAAVIAYQNSEGLLADGVAGPRTLYSLGLAAVPTLPDATPQLTVQVVSRMCPDAPIGHIKQSLPALTAALTRYRLVDKTMLLMAVATIHAEAATFLPIDEGVSRYNTSPGGRPFDLYDFRKDLGNNAVGDGARFKGRGFIQLTGRNNYGHYGPRLAPAVDLVGNPDAANAADTAADLLCLFLSDREIQIKDALAHANMQAARRLVNGGTYGLDAFTAAYQAGDALLS